MSLPVETPKFELPLRNFQNDQTVTDYITSRQDFTEHTPRSSVHTIVTDNIM